MALTVGFSGRPITYLPGHAPAAAPAEGRPRSTIRLGCDRLSHLRVVEMPVAALQFEPFDRIIRNTVHDV